MTNNNRKYAAAIKMVKEMQHSPIVACVVRVTICHEDGTQYRDELWYVTRFTRFHGNQMIDRQGNVGDVIEQFTEDHDGILHRMR